MKDKMFPDLPADLGKLSVSELEEARAELRAIAKRVGDRDPELLGERTMQEILEELQAGVEAIDAISVELETRGAEDQEFEASLRELTEKAGIEEPVAEVELEGEPEVEPAAETEPVAEGEPVADEPVDEPVAAEDAAEPVLAAAEPPRQSLARRPLPRPTAAHKPLEQDSGAVLVAAAGIPGLAGGEVLDRIALARAMSEKRYQGTSMPPGYEEKVLIASVDFASVFPEERKLYGTAEDNDKIRAVVGPEALVASGGLCAPVSNYYELAQLGVTDRPVRDSLAGFQAVRGGLKFGAPPTLADIDDAVGIKTTAQDAAGGTTAAKSCQVVACPDFDEATLDMIYHCVQFGNLGSRAWPEQVAQFNELVMVAHARLAEQHLLDGIAAYCTAVTDTAHYGAMSSFVYGILRAAAGLRSRHRMRPGTPLRILVPSWVPDLLVADNVHTQFGRFELDLNGVETLLRRFGVNVSWYLDTATGAGQIFAAQTAGALLDFPDDIVWYMFPEGSFLFLDGGTLDLGIVRDSTLNNTNDFQIFGETFEQVAFIGVEALEITSRVCPNGTVAAASTPFVCATA